MPIMIADICSSTYRCPGRHTPSNYRAPHASPSVPGDPFAGIPGAQDDSEVW